MKIAIGSDHGGYELKSYLIDELTKLGFECCNLGTDSEKSVDYPDFAKLVAEKVLEDNILGIVICGTGIGISIAANKYRGIRCALCTDEYMASMARKHNDANMLALGARVLGKDLALSITKAFLKEDFEGGRHKIRVDKIGVING